MNIQEAVPQPTDVIVVVDGESDDSWKLAQNLGFRVIQVPNRGGPARARNVGANAAQGDILFFVDADVQIRSDTLGLVKAAFQTDLDLVALIGSYDDEPAELNFLSQYKNLVHHYIHQTARESASTFWGACGAIRRQQFLEIGGFDERYRYPSIEDIELGYRLVAKGCKIKLFRALQVKHLKRWGIVSLLRADFFYRALPWTLLILRDRVLVNDLNTGWSGRLSVLCIYGALGTLAAALWWPQLIVLTSLLLLFLLAFNGPTYRFLLHKRGLLFALRAIPWHWFYYSYSGLAFGLGVVWYGILQSKPTGRTATQPTHRVSQNP
jgi:glycosyltransferase involved in cell wall biosynthesis